jgi:hypothetical protein
MRRRSGRLRGLASTIVLGLAVGAFAAPASATAWSHPAAGCDRGSSGCDEVRFSWLKGFDDPATPDNLDRVGVL